MFNSETALRKKNSIKVIYPKLDSEGNIYRLTNSDISILVDRKRSANDILTKLHNYYLGYNDILNRMNLTQEEINNKVTKPNNRLAHPYAYTITSLISGYFIGQPVRYILPNEAAQLVFDKIMEYNDAPSVDNNLAIDESKFGFSCEQLYLDEDANIRFNNVNPYNLIFVCDDTIDEEPWCVIKFKDNYTLDGVYKEDYDVEVYYSDKVEVYRNNYSFFEERENPFGDVPFILYENNSDFIGDYERVIQLIDAYDLAESDRANDIEYNSDAFLFVKGVHMDDNEAAKMKKLRIFNTNEDNADIKYIEKNNNNQNIQTYVEQINADIHKFSMTPDLNSEAFLASNASGTALKLKFQGLEFICGIKESSFKKGLKRRVELINNILNIRASKDTNLVQDTKIIMTRNNIGIVQELIERANSLAGILTREGQIELLDNIVIDSSKELERLEEQSSPIDSFSNNNDNSNDKSDNENVEDEVK